MRSPAHVVAKGAEERASRSDVNGRERALEGVGQSGPHLRINLSKSLSNIPRQGPPLEVSFHQLTDNMVAVSGAAPVSAEKELVSASEACHEEIKCLFDVISTGGERGIPLQQLLQVTLHGRECSKCLRDRQRAGTWRPRQQPGGVGRSGPTEGPCLLYVRAPAMVYWELILWQRSHPNSGWPKVCGRRE